MHKVISSASNIFPKPQPAKLQWFALHTKFKTEKYVAEQLRKKGFEAYVPVIKVTKRYSKKIKKLELPLISCYVFIRMDTKDKGRVLETEYVYRFVSQTGKEEPIQDDEMDMMKRVVGEFDGEIKSKNLSFLIGEEVEVISGSLTGIKGKLIEKSGKQSFVVELTSVGYELHIEMDKNILRKIN